MQIPDRRNRSHFLAGLLLLASLAIGGCQVGFVADYDSATFEEILRTGKKVDRFYGDLLEDSEPGRKYGKYAQRYVEIETDLRSLYVRNKARALNEESTEIANTILSLWIKYKQAHKDKDGYADGKATRDRNRFVRLFTSAADAESAKRLHPDDRDPAKESK